MGRVSANMARLASNRAIEILISFAAFFVLTALAYRQILDGWFVADDFLWLELSNVDSVLASFTGPWGHGRAYRPLTRVTYLLDYWLYGKHFTGWILTNMGLHAMVCTALYCFGFLIWRNRVTAVILAVLFCLSPIAAENVAWISGRTHILSALFTLLSMLAVWRFLQGRGHWASLPVGVSLFAAGLLCYEAAAYGMAFCAVAVASVSWQRRSVDIRSVMTLGAFAVAFLAYLMIRETALSSVTHAFSTPRDPSWAGLVRDVRLSANILFGWSQLALPLVLLGATALILRPILITTTAVACGVLVLVSLLPFLVLEHMGTRFFYSAQVFVVAFAAVAGRELLRDRRIWVRWGGAALLCFMLFNSVDRIGQVTRDWRDSGAIARSLAVQVKSMFPRPPLGAAMLIHGAPVAYRSAPLFMGYLDKVVRWHYDEFDGVILNAWEFGDANFLPHVIRGQVAHVKASCPSIETVARPDFMEIYGTLQALHDLIFECPVVFVAFDRTTLTIREVTREEWFALFESEPGMLKMP